MKGLTLLRWSLSSCRGVRSEISLLPVVIDRLVLLSPPRQLRYQPRQYSGEVSDTFSGGTMHHPLREEKVRQFLTSDKETIVCVHPTTPVDVCATQPLRPRKPELDQLRSRLSPEEEKFVKKLRSQDAALWTISTLAKLFNVKRSAISKMAPANEARKEELDREKEILERIKPYKRSIYMAEQALKRQKRLRQIIAENNYKFPGHL